MDELQEVTSLSPEFARWASQTPKEATLRFELTGQCFEYRAGATLCRTRSEQAGAKLEMEKVFRNQGASC